MDKRRGAFDEAACARTANDGSTSASSSVARIAARRPMPNRLRLGPHLVRKSLGRRGDAAAQSP